MDSAYVYDEAGATADRFSLDSANRSRGVAFSEDGSRMFVLNANRRVHVFDTETETELGSWKANGLVSVQGISVVGNDILIVDRSRRRVFRFENAVQQMEGQRSADSSFWLDHRNINASGMATDGERLGGRSLARSSLCLRSQWHQTGKLAAGQEQSSADRVDDRPE